SAVSRSTSPSTTTKTASSRSRMLTPMSPYGSTPSINERPAGFLRAPGRSGGLLLVGNLGEPGQVLDQPGGRPLRPDQHEHGRLRVDQWYRPDSEVRERHRHDLGHRGDGAPGGDDRSDLLRRHGAVVGPARRPSAVGVEAPIAKPLLIAPVDDAGEGLLEHVLDA